MNTILITGYNGFIGRNLIKALNGFRLIGVDLQDGLLVDEHIGWSDLERVKDIDCVIHLAGKAHDTENRNDSQEYYDVNVGLTKQIFKVFLESNSKKFIYFSSVAAVTDNIPSEHILTEETLANPLSHYGKSKLEAEKYLHDQIIPVNKLVYILRPSMVHGKGNKGNLPLLFSFVKKGFPWPLGAFKNKRTFTYIENLLYVVKQIINKDIDPGIYHVVDDEAIFTNDLVRTIMKTLNKPVRIWNIPPIIIKFLAKAGDLLNLPINSFRLKKLTTSLEVSNQKIKNALEIDKMPFKAIEGIQISIDTLTRNGKSVIQ